MTNTTQPCNTCDTVDYDGTLDEAGRCYECVAFIALQARKHDGIHAKTPCERAWRASGKIIFDAYVSREDDAAAESAR